MGELSAATLILVYNLYLLAVTFDQLLRAFEDLHVFWRATFSKDSLNLVSNGVNLTAQLVHTSGTAVCRRGEITCALSLEVLDDKVRG